MTATTEVTLCSVCEDRRKDDPLCTICALRVDLAASKIEADLARKQASRLYAQTEEADHQLREMVRAYDDVSNEKLQITRRLLDYAGDVKNAQNAIATENVKLRKRVEELQREVDSTKEYVTGLEDHVTDLSLRLGELQADREDPQMQEEIQNSPDPS